MPKSKTITIIGAGFSGLASACYLAQANHQVRVLERHAISGGRARYYQEAGFTFDMGPSWYWLPDVFENFFADFNKKPSDYYELIRLDPSYRVYFGKDDFIDLPANLESLKKLFEELEYGSGDKLEQFLNEAKYKYQVAVNDLVHKPGLSITEILDPKLILGAFNCDLFNSIRSHMKKFFDNPKILKIMEFPILFLGATPQKTPSLYSFMNYADLALGTWYPQKGMWQIASAMQQLAIELGVEFEFNTDVEGFDYDCKKITGIKTNKGIFSTDAVINSSDYHHCDKEILEEKYSNYSEKYWDRRIMSPSSLLFYIGINKKINNLIHHNLFFDESLDAHAYQIYEKPEWPDSPLFYVCCPSKTDPSVAPENHENLFILIPVAAGIEDSEAIREKYFQIIIKRLEFITGASINEHIIYKKSYAHKDFQQDYNAYKGNAYGLANTLMQTHMLKPSIKSKHLSNLWYTGQLTVPGPGVPPSLISGKVVARELIKSLNNESIIR